MATELSPQARSRLVATTIVASELVLGIWLISGIAYRAAALAAAVLLALFLVYRFGLRALGPNGASCGCLGDSRAADAMGVGLNLLVALAIATVGSSTNRYPLGVSFVLVGMWIVGLAVLATLNRRVAGAAVGVSESIVSKPA